MIGAYLGISFFGFLALGVIWAKKQWYNLLIKMAFFGMALMAGWIICHR